MPKGKGKDRRKRDEAQEGRRAGQGDGQERERGTKTPHQQPRRAAGTAGNNGDASAKSTLTRARILHAAAVVLKERGYAASRLSDIAEVAEVQAPALYYYFKSREELIEEVVTIGQRRVFDHVTETLAAHPDLEPIDRIRLAVRAQLEVTLRDSAHASAAIRTSSHLPPEIRERQLVEQRRYGDLWRKLISDAADAGQVNSELNRSSARLFALGALNWVPEWWNPKLGSLDDVIANAQIFVLDGLRKRD